MISNSTTSTRSTRRSFLGGIAAGLALLAVSTLTPGCAIDQAFGGSRDAAPTTTTSSPGTSTPDTHSDSQSGTAATPSVPSSPASVPGGSGMSGLSAEQAAKVVQDTDDAADAINGYWAEHWSDYFTGEYAAPQVVGLYDGSDPSSAPQCDGTPLSADNAYYCSDGDFVAWDSSLMARSADLGNSWVYLIIAHEWGHAMITSLSPELHWNSEELQADCMAGAAIYGAAADGTVTLPDTFEKQITSALGDLADDTAWTQSSEHGDAFQRIDAFNQGRTGGVNACLPE